MTTGKTIALTSWTFIGKEQYCIIIFSLRVLWYQFSSNMYSLSYKWLSCILNDVWTEIISKEWIWVISNRLILRESMTVLSPGESHGQRSLVGCSPWGCRGSDMTERLHFHFSLSCIGEGNGNPLQYSCLENPRDRGAWWAAVHGVAQSRTRLKRLSSSMTRLTQLIFLFEEENLKMCDLLSMTMLLICKESLKFLLKSKQKN